MEEAGDKECVDITFHNISKKDVRKIIDALEKADSKEPSLEGDGYDPEGNLVYDMWICPNCGWRYDTDYEGHCYCPNCGQKIDWSYMEGNGERYEEDCE